MLLWASLLVFAPVCGQSAAAHKPVISVHPPWTTFFKGERVTLTCNGFQFYATEKTTWYHRHPWGEKLTLTPGNTLEVRQSGLYRCQARGSPRSNPVHLLFSSELFPQPELKATDSQPTEGNSVNLSCETQLPPERSDTPLHFIFFRDDGVNLSDWSRSPELQLPTVWRENSGSYWCSAETVMGNIHKHSLSLQIHVQRIPVSGVLLETQPSGGQAVEGEMLVLVCSVAEGTGDTTFSWHRKDTQESLGRKTQHSLRAELELPAVRQSHAGEYYCTADNSYGPVQSAVLNVTVRETPGNRDGLVAAGATGGLLSALLLAMALLFHCWRRRKSGAGFLGDETRLPPAPGPGESSHSICPAQVELQSLHVDVHLKKKDLIYAEIQTIRLGEEGEANNSRTLLEDKDVSVVYSEVKTQHPDNSAGKVSSKDEESYENEKLQE
ncbi:Fc receptor-like protein 4 isoform X5 [Symphalangus syndactylus]|uniref:Fc receptor-like protein 4 isoform X5 n=1 Tax=Symphalangus syndactylus TaxID=9590 RepID=UPI00300776BA